MDVNKKLSSLEEISKLQLSKILKSNPNTKHLVLEPRLIKPLERVCGVKWLQENGVLKIFKLETVAPPDFEANGIFFMIFSNSTTFKLVLDQIRSKIDLKTTNRNKFHIIVVPKYPLMYEEELEGFGLYSIVKLYSFQWMPIYLDTGILSLEIPFVYEHLFVHQNLTLLPVLSKILWQLFFVVGKPKFMLALGEYSNAILTQYDMLCTDKYNTDKPDCDFSGLIILDRNIDYCSALLTPCTYSGLLNEVYGVNVGNCDHKTIETDSSLPQAKTTDEKFNLITHKQPVNIKLQSSTDSVYSDIKYRYFTEVTTVLSEFTKQLKVEKTNSERMDLNDMKQYVQKQLQVIKNRKKLITNHLIAAETIINVMGPRFERQREIEHGIMQNSSKKTNLNYLEELISLENNEYISLRLFCLMLITQKLSESEIESFWTKFIHNFGFNYGFAYNNLMNVHFIKNEKQQATMQSSVLTKLLSNNFYTNVNNLKQIVTNPEKINLKVPNCPSYVFAGSYIPLISQICSFLLNSTPLNDVQTKLNTLGPVTVRNDDNNRSYPLHARSLLIYVVGGVTYAEIAACQLLENLTGSKIVILSDKVISGNDLMKAILSVPS